jgi:AraC family transcriptional regulator
MMQLSKICAAVICDDRSGRKKVMTTPYEKRIHRVIDHIHSNPSGNLSLDALAEVAALSRFHFHRVFRAVMGETAAQSVRRIRLHRASVALAQSETPLIRVATDVGYPNLASFSRAFADTYGTTPLAFRNRGELRPFSRQTQPELTIMYPIEIRTEAPRRLAAVPHKGPYHEINRAFQNLSTTMAQRGLFGHAGHMVGVFYDDPQSVAAADLRSHAGFEMTGKIQLDPPLDTVTLDGGRHAVLIYTGPYAGLPAAYDQLFGVWLPASGEDVADVPSFEIYLNSPMDTAPEDLITELHLPLK